MSSVFESHISPVLSSAVDVSKDIKDRIPFLIAGVADKEKILYIDSYGVKDLTDPNSTVDNDTKFYYFSTSKAITTTLLIILIDKGLIKSIDDPVEDYVPEIKDLQVLTGFKGDEPVYEPAKSKVTLKQLVTHTSGFAYAFMSPDILKWSELNHFNLSRCEWSQVLTPLSFQPGTTWCYSTGLEWAGMVVQRASGMTLDEFMKVHIFEPLKMTNTSFVRTDKDMEVQAKTHARDPVTGELTPSPELFPQVPEFQCGGMGLFGTCGDYLKFLQIFINEGKSPLGEQILNVELMNELMLKDQVGEEVNKDILQGMFNESELDPEKPRPVFSYTCGFKLTNVPLPSGRGSPSFSWNGLANTFYWIDYERKVVCYFASSITPFGDDVCIKTLNQFEKGVYAALDSYK